MMAGIRVSAWHVHLVFITKYRYRVLDRDAVDRLRLLFRKICTYFESQLTEMHGEVNHVHLVVRYPPKVAISKLVNSLKGLSSRMLRQERPGKASCGRLPISPPVAAVPPATCSTVISISRRPRADVLRSLISSA